MMKLHLKNLLACFTLLGLMCGAVACSESSSADGSATTESSQQGNSSANTSTGEANETRTVIKFDTTFHDFGEVVEGQKVTHRYTFTNIGTNPLIIQKVKPSCGCTSPSYTTEPVPPGGKGYVDLQFDSSNKDGETRKSAQVIANTDPVATKLEYRALVVPRKKS